MIYPIVLYGDPVLKRKADEVKKDHPELKSLIEDMFETMYSANGVGLAAPQIGKSLRIFVIDSTPTEEKEEDGIKKAFINPEILEQEGDDEPFEEGCLSIPGIREDVQRPPRILIRYVDEKFREHEEEYEGMAARIIQHEYDHVDGILFTDHISAFKRRLLKGKLTNISKGKVDADYRVKVPMRR